MIPTTPETVILSSTKKGFNKKTLLIIGFILILVILAYLIFQNRGLLDQRAVYPVSSYALSLTQPVYSIPGTVKEIKGETLIIDYEIRDPSISFASASPLPKPKVLTFKVILTANTNINQAPNPMRVFDASGSGITRKNLRAGQKINVTSKTDLRLLTSDQFEAVSISIEPPVTSINGVITKISDNNVTIKGSLLISSLGGPPVLPESKEYSFILNSQTMVNKNNDKLSLKDLKNGMEISVTSDQDIEGSNQPAALKIDIIPSIASGAASLLIDPLNGSTGSASPKP